MVKRKTRKTEVESQVLPGTLEVIKNPEVAVEPLKAKIADSKPFLLCTFCKNKQYESNSKDPTSHWCVKCGKAFMAAWQEADIEVSEQNGSVNRYTSVADLGTINPELGVR